MLSMEVSQPGQSRPGSGISSAAFPAGAAPWATPANRLVSDRAHACCPASSARLTSPDNALASSPANNVPATEHRGLGFLTQGSALLVPDDIAAASSAGGASSATLTAADEILDAFQAADPSRQVSAGISAPPMSSAANQGHGVPHSQEGAQRSAGSRYGGRAAARMRGGWPGRKSKRSADPLAASAAGAKSAAAAVKAVPRPTAKHYPPARVRRLLQLLVCLV